MKAPQKFGQSFPLQNASLTRVNTTLALPLALVGQYGLFNLWDLHHNVFHSSTGPQTALIPLVTNSGVQ